jgi:hypothetical protein
MSSSSLSRRRERQYGGNPTTIKTGKLFKKNAQTNAIVQTIQCTGSTWPFSFQEVTWDQIHKGPPYRSGGPFASVKAIVDTSIQGSGSHKSPPEGGYYWQYDGGFVRPFLSYEQPTLDLYKNLAVVDPYEDGLLVSNDALGSEAYDRIRPTLNHADVSVFSYEMKDTARMLKTSGAFFKNVFSSYAPRAQLRSTAVDDSWIRNFFERNRRIAGDKSKKAADHYLNHQFGWVPFVNDLLKINETYQNQRRYIDQITKDNGSWIRRVRTLSSENTETLDTHGGYQQGIGWRTEFSQMCNNISASELSSIKLTRTVVNTTRTWAAGSFTYYRPEFDKSLSDYESNWNEAMRLLTLYGARINPYVLWKVTPWTWLLDWFVGVGTLIDRAVSWAFDGVVSRYMYLMQHNISAMKHSVHINWKDGPTTLTWLNYIESKQREVADNNFSFRLSGTLSARQLAIIAALGLSRRR